MNRSFAYTTYFPDPVEGLTIHEFYRLTGRMQPTDSIIAHVNMIASPFGAGWHIGGVQFLVESANGLLLLVDGDGTHSIFRPDGEGKGVYRSPEGDFSELIKHTNGTFSRTMKDRSVYLFDSAGRLTSRTDRSGNATQYVYESDRLTQIVDAAGLATVLSYVGNRVSTIQDPIGRTTTLRYDAVGNLTSITDPDGSVRSFEYDNDRHIIAEVDQMGRREETQYGFHGRAIGSRRKDGTTLRFDPLQTRALLPAEHTSRPWSAPTAPLAAAEAIARHATASGNVTTTILDQRGLAVRSSDAIGGLTNVERDSQGLVTSFTNARGFLSEFSYDARGNVLSVTDEVVRQAGTGGSLFPGRRVRDRGFALRSCHWRLRRGRHARSGRGEPILQRHIRAAGQR